MIALQLQVDPFDEEFEKRKQLVEDDKPKKKSEDEEEDVDLDEDDDLDEDTDENEDDVDGLTDDKEQEFE